MSENENETMDEFHCTECGVKAYGTSGTNPTAHTGACRKGMRAEIETLRANTVTLRKQLERAQGSNTKSKALKRELFTILQCGSNGRIIEEVKRLKALKGAEDA